MLRRSRISIAGGALAVLLGLQGCAATGKRLVFACSTGAGINVDFADGVPTEVGFAVKRDQFIKIPVGATVSECGSYAGGVAVRGTWAGGLDITQACALGGAADMLVSGSSKSGGTDVQPSAARFAPAPPAGPSDSKAVAEIFGQALGLRAPAAGEGSF